MEYEAVKREAQMRADALQTQSEQHKSAVADLAKREAELRRQVEDLASVRVSVFRCMARRHLTVFVCV